MDCPDFLEQLEEIAVTGPELDLPPEMLDHQTACDGCRKQLMEFQGAWLLMPAVLERQPIAPELEAKVMQRISTSPAMVSLDSPSTFWKYALAASVLIVLVGGSVITSAWFAGKQADSERIRNLARQMDKLERLERTFAAPQLHYVSLRSVGLTHRVEGYLLYDLIAMEGHFFGFHLLSPPAGYYRIWLLDKAGNGIASVRVDVDSNQLGAAVVKLPENVSLLKEAIVTLELEADPRAPSSQVRMRTRIDL